MKIVFQDTQLEELIEGEKCGKYKKYLRDAVFLGKLTTLIAYLGQCVSVAEAQKARRFAIERLVGDRSGQYSARVDYKRKERLIFTTNEEQTEVTVVLIELSVDHYGTAR